MVVQDLGARARHEPATITHRTPWSLMLTPDHAEPQSYVPASALPPLVATDLQDHLMVASNDLDRLQRLLNGACDVLLTHYHGADSALKRLLQISSCSGSDPAALDPAEARAALQHLGSAITALQFQDLASQLVDHTQRRLRNCADRLACDTMVDDEDGEAMVTAAPDRPNPVTQDEMDAGSIELF